MQLLLSRNLTEVITMADLHRLQKKAGHAVQTLWNSLSRPCVSPDQRCVMRSVHAAKSGQLANLLMSQLPPPSTPENETEKKQNTKNKNKTLKKNTNVKSKNEKKMNKKPCQEKTKTKRERKRKENKKRKKTITFENGNERKQKRKDFVGSIEDDDQHPRTAQGAMIVRGRFTGQSISVISIVDNIRRRLQSHWIEQPRTSRK